MPVTGNARGPAWTDDELRILASHPELSAREMMPFLPGRSSQAIGNIRLRRLGDRGGAFTEVPPVKAPGDYIEVLSAYLLDDFDCAMIWCKWNGYMGYRELSRDERGWVTLLCTAKG